MESERHARLHEVYEIVRHLPREARAGRARTLCGDDTELLALGSADGTVKLADTRSGKLAASLEVGERVDGITWSRDGRHLFALSAQGELRRWSIEAY